MCILKNYKDDFSNINFLHFGWHFISRSGKSKAKKIILQKIVFINKKTDTCIVSFLKFSQPDKSGWLFYLIKIMSELLTFEEAFNVIRPNKKYSYAYSQTRINNLIQSGDLKRPDIYAKTKEGDFVVIEENNIRLVTAESVHSFAENERLAHIRPIVAVYCDGTKKHFSCIRKAEKHYGVYYRKIKNIINKNEFLEVQLIGERIKIIHEDCSDTTLKTEFIKFIDEKIR